MTKKLPTKEEIHLFRQTIGKVRDIKNDKVQLSSESKPKPYPKRSLTSIQDAPKDIREADIEMVGMEDTLSFVVDGLPKNVLTKLRQGHFGLDAEIDLHGLNSQEAKTQLLFFIQSCLKDKCRCIHIIHGKGYRSEERFPVLKNNLNFWLRQHKDVQAFCSASPKDGGTGAVYVLLHAS